VVPLNALAAALLLVLLPHATLGRPHGVIDSQPILSGLWQDSDRQIRDIRPVDSAGNPLTGIYLFDQDGQPIDVSGGQCSVDPDGLRGIPGSAGDQPYPRGTSQYDPRVGECVHVPPAPLVVAVPSATPPPSVTPAPAPGAGAVPTVAPPAPPTDAPSAAATPVPFPPSAAPPPPAPSALLPAPPATPPAG
jgi:hypothetical protein